MFVKLITFVLVLSAPQAENKKELTCDSLKHQPFSEGNLGQTGILSWLGVIRAHFHVGPKTNIAVTGAVLIKPKHALANADDMSKIRKEGDSKAMFISADRGTWTCKISEVYVHPEYEFSTYSTFALVELDTESLIATAPMLPVCLPTYMYNTSNQLYALGFTDEHKLLEKVAYKVEYVEKALCDEFYLRAGHGTGMWTPLLYECAFASNNMKNCEWENGMALVSNASGLWVLVGFGVQGPGCSAPARFINVFSYLNWIESTASSEDFDADYPFKIKVRRTDTSETVTSFTKDINSTITRDRRLWGIEMNDNVTFDTMGTTNYFKKDRKPLNITFQEFLKQKENEGKPLV